MNAQEGKTANFLNGNRYLELTEEVRLVYVAGLLDMLYFIFYLEHPEVYKNVEAKTKDMSLGQVQKMLL